MKLIRNLFVVCAALLLVGSAMAQGGGRGQRGFGMMGGMGDSSGIQLLFGTPRQPARKDVQADLNLTDDQKSKIDAVSQKMMEDMRAMFQGGGQPDQDAIMKMRDNAKAEITKILTKDQMSRLKEINIQIAGNTAATWKDVQKDLGLSDDQISKIKDLQTKQGEANQALFQKMRDQEITREELQADMKKNSESFSAEVGKILTDDQKSKLKTMGGKEFKADTGGGL